MSRYNNSKTKREQIVDWIISLKDLSFFRFWMLRATNPLQFRISLISQMWDELCRHLFHHIFEREESISTEDYLAHLFLHFQKNQDHITSLLFSKMTTSSINSRESWSTTSIQCWLISWKKLTQIYLFLTSNTWSCPTLSRHWLGGSKKDKTLHTRKLSSFI